MIWVIIFLTIGVGALCTLIAYGVWLAHKASDLFSEIAVLGTRAAELGDMLAQIGSGSSSVTE